MPNNFIYNPNVPNPPNNPQTDVPLMKVNTNSISSLISIDHIGFNTNGSGIHKQVTLANESAPGLGDGNGVLYANLASGQSWPFWQNALGSTQLLSQFAQSVTNGNSTGWVTSLPGGLKVSAGYNTTVIDGTTISILTTFATIFSFTMTALGSSSNGTNRALLAQPRSINQGAGTCVVNMRDTNNSAETVNHQVFFFIVGN